MTANSLWRGGGVKWTWSRESASKQRLELFQNVLQTSKGIHFTPSHPERTQSAENRWGQSWANFN